MAQRFFFITGGVFFLSLSLLAYLVTWTTAHTQFTRVNDTTIVSASGMTYVLGPDGWKFRGNVFGAWLK